MNNTAKAINIQNVHPEKAQLPGLFSAGQNINFKRLQEFRPSSNVETYKSDSASPITFKLSSDSSYWDITQSYLGFDFSATVKNGGEDCLAAYLAEGGGHSLFSKVVVRSNDGREIQSYPEYAKYYSLISGVNHSENYVDRVLSMSGDSVDGYRSSTSSIYPTLNELTGSAHDTNAAGTTLTGTGSLYMSELHVGDIIHLQNASASTSVKVTAITSNTAVSISGHASSAVTYLDAYINSSSRQPARNSVVKDGGRLLLQLDHISSLGVMRWVNLFLMRGGVELEFTLAPAWQSLIIPQDTIGAGYEASYEISKPRIYARMITATPNLVAEARALQQAGDLEYPYQRVEYESYQIQAGATGDVSIPLSKVSSSATHVFFKLQDERTRSKSGATVDAGKSSFTVDAAAQSISANLEEYYMMIGSDQYPNTKIKCTDTLKSQVMAETEHALGTLWFDASNRIPHERWSSEPSPYMPFEQGRYGGRSASDRLIYGISLKKDESQFSGLNLKNQSVSLNLQLGSSPYQISDMDGSNAVNASLTVHIFVLSDGVLSVNPHSIVNSY